MQAPLSSAISRAKVLPSATQPVPEASERSNFSFSSRQGPKALLAGIVKGISCDPRPCPRRTFEVKGEVPCDPSYGRAIHGINRRESELRVCTTAPSTGRSNILSISLMVSSMTTTTAGTVPPLLSLLLATVPARVVQQQLLLLVTGRIERLLMVELLPLFEPAWRPGKGPWRNVPKAREFRSDSGVSKSVSARRWAVLFIHRHHVN